MMAGINPVLHPAIIALWAMLCIALTLTVYVRLRGVVSPPYVAGLIALRALAVALLILLLVQPFYFVRKPAKQNFHVTLLADTSRSMQTEDCSNGRKRIDVLRDILKQPQGDGSLLRKLKQEYTLRTFQFSDTREHLDEEIPVLPGDTALGKVLQQTLNESTAAMRLGSVVLLSDGHGNVAPSALDIAQKFRDQGVPISCIGIGEKRRTADIKVTSSRDKITTQAGRSTAIPVTIHKSFDQTVDIPLRLSKGGLTEDTKQLHLDKGLQTKEVQLQATPDTAGFHTYRIHTPSIPEDQRPETDTTFVAVKARQRPGQQILYLGAHLTAEHKFLRIAAQDSEKIKLSSIVKSGEDNTFFRSLSEDSPAAETDGFPVKAEVLNSFHGILLDTRTIALLPPEAKKNLISFVSQRGGGMLCIGPRKHLSSKLQKILPVRKAEERRSSRKLFLEFNPTPVFPEDAMSELKASAGPYLPERLTTHFLTKTTRGARPCLVYPEENLPVLAAQRYGSGRTAYLGTEGTWRWHLASAEDKRRHHTFWRELVGWLSAGTKKRMSAPFDGTKRATHKSTDLEVSVVGQDFRPATGAEVTARIETPEGSVEEKSMVSSLQTPGTYTSPVTPSETGEYKVTVNAQLTEEAKPELKRTFHFLGVPKGKETENTSYRENVLRDVARITDGRFVPYQRASGLMRNLPLSETVPVKEKRIDWNDCWWFLIPLLLIPLVEWYLRRRIGLR